MEIALSIPRFVFKIGVKLAPILLLGLIIGLVVVPFSASTSSTKSPPPQKRIAFVDDDKDYLEGAIEIIADFGGWLVYPFYSCAELVTIMQTAQRFDLYILDFNLGDTLGTECVPLIRTFHPGALIIGNSFASEAEEPFGKLELINFWTK